MTAENRFSVRRIASLPGCLLAGLLCMAAFTLSPEGYVGESDLPLRAGSPVWVFYALLMGGLFWLTLIRLRLRPSAGMLGFGLLFGVVNYFATTLFAYDTWAFLSSAQAWALAALRVLGQAAVMTAAITLICDRLEQAQAGNPPPEKAKGFVRRLTGRFPRVAALYRRHPTLLTMGWLLLCWSPYLMVFYPGTVIWDMGEMLGQLYGLREMSTWHPVLTTWLFGGCVGLGRLVGSDNLGTFLFTMLQTLALAYALADAVRLLRRMGLGKGWQLAALAFFGLTPIFGSFAQAVGKDTLYTAALLLFTVRTAETLRYGAPKPRGLTVYALCALLTCLVRTNGLYVVLGTAILALAFGFRGKAKLRVGGALAAALALAFTFNNLLLPALRIKDETASGLYSVCFQQTARTLRDHAETVTPDEYAEVDRVLDAKNLPKLYEANISDPVKYTFRQYGEGRAAEQRALARYRKTWLTMFQKYPLTYLEAWIAGNSGYYAFTPKIDASRTYNNQGGIRFVFETYELGADPRYLHTTQIAGLEKARELLAAYSRGWRRVPVLELALFCPAYTWLTVAAGLSLARRRRWRELCAFAPALLSLGVCLLSPVNDYFRYFLPIVAMTLPLLGMSRAGNPCPVGKPGQ